MDDLTFIGYQCQDDFKDGEMRIRDVELGERLGYDRPRNIRKLIKTLEKQELLTSVEVCFVPPQTSGGRPSSEYWLTEKQSLKVISRANTVVADQIWNEVIDIFIAWRHGKLCPILLRSQMCEWSRFWGPDVCASICELYGYIYRGRCPSFMAPIFKRLYCLYLGKANYEEIKKRNPKPQKGSNHHQHLTEAARTILSEKIIGVKMMASAAVVCDLGIEWFWQILEHQEGLGGVQLQMFNSPKKPALRLVPGKPD